MSVHLSNVTFDCRDSMALAGFWSAVLSRPVADGSGPGFASIVEVDAQPGWCFIEVPDGKSAKNRVHVDLHADDREAEVERLVALGAKRSADHEDNGSRWTVLADIEGNEFCVI